MNPTPEAVARTNFRNAVKMLTAKLNHNFVPGDYHLTLTYEKVKAPADAKKCLDNFIRKVRSACKKEGVVLKWVAVTEYKQHRIHHHLVISGIDVDTLDRCWKYGRINVAPLDPSGNYHRLAEYLLKETEETFRPGRKSQQAKIQLQQEYCHPGNPQGKNIEQAGMGRNQTAEGILC